MKKVLFLSVISFLLIACSNQQDPLAGAPDSVRNGVPPTDTVEETGEKPIAKDALQIDSPNLINGQVNTAIEFNIAGRVLIPDVSFELKIENIADFPGATYNEASGVFNWTPKPEVLRNNFFTQFNLVVSLITLPGKTKFPISIEKKTIVMNVVNAFDRPTVRSIQSTATYETGSIYNLPIELFVDRAQTRNDFSLFFNTCTSSYYSPIHQVVTYNSRNFVVDPSQNKISGNLKLDLSANPYTYSPTDYCFSVVAISSSGVSSESYEVRMKMKVPASQTKSTLSKITIKKGDAAAFNFSFFDPYQKGRLSIISNDKPEVIMPGSTLECLNIFPFQIDCKLFVSTNDAPAGNYELKFSIANSAGSFQSVQTDHMINIQVTEPL